MGAAPSGRRVLRRTSGTKQLKGGVYFT
eukprot:COSAG01_NODE_12280_length_1767_cov_1.169065_1_plen_27_part_10